MASDKKGLAVDLVPNRTRFRSNLKNWFSTRNSPSDKHVKLIRLVNRKNWWHVPPRDPQAYRKRGKFLASTYREAEFWGLPLIDPQRVTIARPLVGDEYRIERTLFGRRLSSEDMSTENRFGLDARMKRTALRRGYDSILLMSPLGFVRFQNIGKVPRSLELNILLPDSLRQVTQ